MASDQTGGRPVETVAKEEHLRVVAGRRQGVGHVYDRLARRKLC